MIKYNTRFCPTVNGPLHTGHLYAILINQAEAHHSGGKFTIRFDDSQRGWHWHFTDDEIRRYKQLMHEDMDWLGIAPDAWSSQEDLMPTVERLARFLGYEIPAPTFADWVAAEVIGSSVSFYPMVERQTAEHVLMDFLEGINWCIRGIDLLTEDCLYRYFQERLELNRVRTTYIPRLIFDGDVINKTTGKFKLCDFRQKGIDPKSLIGLLAKDCLNDPVEAWQVDNIRPVPKLGAWAKEVLNG